MAQRCQSIASKCSRIYADSGRPLAESQTVHLMLAESKIEMHATRAMVHEAARKTDMGESVQREARIIKFYSMEMASRVIDRALKIHGATGYSEDPVIEQLYRAIQAVRLSEGPNEVHRWRLARNMLRT